MVESSKAVLCPSVAYQLAGAKKVQQDLARPGVLERFVPDAPQAERLREHFAGVVFYLPLKSAKPEAGVPSGDERKANTSPSPGRGESGLKLERVLWIGQVGRSSFARVHIGASWCPSQPFKALSHCCEMP